VDHVHGLWTAQGWPVHGSTVDLTVAGGRSSPELGLVAASVHGDTLRQGRNRGGRFDYEARPAAVKLGGYVLWAWRSGRNGSMKCGESQRC
jgi:hypothetical protein